MKRFELKKKDWLSTSVFRIALVENPAIETDFIYLNKEGKPLLFSVQEEKRMIYSPVLIPDQNIPRVSESGEAYEIFLTADTIEEIARDYMLEKRTLGEWNYEHDEKQKLTGVDVVENWIVQDPSNDKATLLGFKVPSGTWMQGTYITNDQVLSDIKSKKVKGVSVEMDMAHELINLSINQNSEMTETNKLLGEILVKLGMKTPGKTNLASVDVGEGVMIYADSFEEGAAIFKDQEMLVPAEGVFESDGKVMTVEGGVLISVTEKVAEELEKPFDHEAMESEVATIKSATALSVEAVIEMSAENVSLKSELASVKELLTKLEAATNLNTEKLAKVQNVDPKSITKLSGEESGVMSYLNNRKSF